jgi:hypothetical protein
MWWAALTTTVSHINKSNSVHNKLAKNGKIFVAGGKYFITLVLVRNPM